MSSDEQASGWRESDTMTFLDLARYAVPFREHQLEIIVSLLPATEEPFDVIEVCCGEGLLSAAILERYPQAWLTAFDGSAAMIQQARSRCEDFGVRFVAKLFDLEDRSWRRPTRMPRAVVTSLALHHLGGEGKQIFFRDVHRMLARGGILTVADIVEPASEPSRRFAAAAWDQAVLARAQRIDGNANGFEAFEAEGWNLFRHPDPEVDKPSTLVEQLGWMRAAGFAGVDVYWMAAGHAIFGGIRP